MPLVSRVAFPSPVKDLLFKRSRYRCHAIPYIPLHLSALVQDTLRKRLYRNIRIVVCICQYHGLKTRSWIRHSHISIPRAQGSSAVMFGVAVRNRPVSKISLCQDRTLPKCCIPLTIATAPARAGGIGDRDPIRSHEPDVLDRIDVSEAWGVGLRLTRKLQGMNITTVGDLSRADPARIRHHFSAPLQRTVLGLRGIPAIKLDDFDAISRSRKQQIMCSRMFGHPVNGLGTILDHANRKFDPQSAGIGWAGMKGKGG